MIIPFYVVGILSFLLVLKLWYGGMRVVDHDVRVFVIQGVPHIMVKHNSLGHLKCWSLWSVDEKLISVLDVVGHNIILRGQSEVQDVSYSLGVIPDRIVISGEVANFVGVCHSFVTMET